MGRQKTPTRILEARNSFKKHPERRRDGEPEVRGSLGGAPDRLNEIESKAWHEIGSTAPMGVLTEADRLDVEMAARLLARVWTDFDSVSDGARKQLHTMLGKYGMNPSDRSRLSIEKPKEVSRWEQIG